MFSLSLFLPHFRPLSHCGFMAQHLSTNPTVNLYFYTYMEVLHKANYRTLYVAGYVHGHEVAYRPCYDIPMNGGA